MLRGLDKLIEKETGIKTKIVDEPLTTVVRGLGILIEDEEKANQLGVSFD